MAFELSRNERAAGAYAIKNAVVFFSGKQGSRRVQQSDIIGYTVNMRGLGREGPDHAR